MSNAGYEMTGWGQFCARLRGAAIRFRRRWIPYLVWHDAEIDCIVTLTENKLPQINAETPEDAMRECASSLSRGSFYEVEKHFAECGITFDKGLGPNGRDWEWDWSLRGPISVRFRGLASKPDRRV